MAEYLMVVFVDAEPIDGAYRVDTGDGGVSVFPAEAFEKYCLPLSDSSRITQAEVDAMIGAVDQTQVSPKTTLVRVIAKTGYEDYATSSCVDPANYDDAIGTRLGLKKIEDRIWDHLGFALQWAKNGLTTATAEANEHLESKPPAEGVETDED